MDDDGNAEEVQRALLKNGLQKQLDEFQMLSAIFCNPGELHVDDYGCLDNLNSYINGETNRLTTKLDYRFDLPLLPNQKVQILVELPHLYPALEIPRIVIRSAVIPRDQERMLISKIEQYIEEEVVERDEPYVYQVVGWIQDNFAELMQTTAEKKEPNQPAPSKRSVPGIESVVFERLWIYSHHLKSKTKRQTIIKTARDLKLTGFSRPGKPAIICVEGQQNDTQEFWRTIKPLKWQKIQIKFNETETVSSENEMAALRHFESGFREELFCELDSEDSDTEDQPMSMSLFMKFLEKHNCSYIKKELFGFHNSNEGAIS